MQDLRLFIKMTLLFPPRFQSRQRNFPTSAKATPSFRSVHVLHHVPKFFLFSVHNLALTIQSKSAGAAPFYQNEIVVPSSFPIIANNLPMSASARRTFNECTGLTTKPHSYLCFNNKQLTNYEAPSSYHSPNFLVNATGQLSVTYLHSYNAS